MRRADGAEKGAGMGCVGGSNSVQFDTRGENVEQYLSVKEAAAALDVHPNTIRNWLRDGTLVAYQKGGRVLASRRQVEGFIQPREEVACEMGTG